MTFNIRYDRTASSAGDPDFWPDRVPALQDLLRREVPAVLGVQEALHHQLTAIESALPARYRMIGTGRQGGSRSEYTAVFYDARRLKLIEWDQFWLSDTPRMIGSSTWGNGVTRCATWGRFLDTVTQREVLVLNTHFDHESAVSRLRSAEAVLDLVRVFHPRLPSVVLGDFNADAGACPAHAALTGSALLQDAWDSASEQATPDFGTFPRYGTPVEGGPRIDWILTSSDIAVRTVAVNTSTLEGRYASDHVPVQALLELPR